MNFLDVVRLGCLNIEIKILFFCLIPPKHCHDCLKKHTFSVLELESILKIVEVV